MLANNRMCLNGAVNFPGNVLNAITPSKIPISYPGSKPGFSRGRPSKSRNAARNLRNEKWNHFKLAPVVANLRQFANILEEVLEYSQRRRTKMEKALRAKEIFNEQAFFTGMKSSGFILEC